MDLLELIKNRRSIRRFKQEQISTDALNKIVNSLRYCPSAANLQPLQYIIIQSEPICKKVFNCTNWAGYITPPWRPAEEERPTAYIAILNSQKNNKWYEKDVGIAMGYLVILAESNNLSTCILCNIKKGSLKTILNIPESIEIEALVAIGIKNETAVVEEDQMDVKYWRDENNIMHIPKKPLDAMVFYDSYS